MTFFKEYIADCESRNLEPLNVFVFRSFHVKYFSDANTMLYVFKHFQSKYIDSKVEIKAIAAPETYPCDTCHDEVVKIRTLETTRGELFVCEDCYKNIFEGRDYQLI